MKKLCTQISLILALLFIGSVWAQEPGITWSKLYKPVGFMGGPSMAVATDGTQLPDGGYLASGSSLAEEVGIYLVRTNSSGDTLWTHQYTVAQTGIAPIFFVNVEIANDGNYYLSSGGLSNAGEGIKLLKVKENGDTLWTSYFTEGAYDTVYYDSDMKVTPDGGVIITGAVQMGAPLIFDVFIVKFTADGPFDWYRRFGHPAVRDMGWTVENAWDGGYLLACTYDTIGINQLRLIKTDNTGQQQWSVVYPISMLDDVNENTCIIRTNDNNYVISGESSGDYFLMKIDQEGNMIWLHFYGLSDYGQKAYCVAQTTDGGYIMTGYQDPGVSDDVIYVVKTDNNGEEEWSKQIDLYYQDITYKIHQTLDNGYLLYGSGRTELGGMDYLMMIKLGGTSAIEGQSASNSSEVIRNYPNPVTSMTTIQYSLPSSCQVTLKLFDIEGNEIKTLVNKNQSAGKHDVHFNSQNLPAGIYYYRLSAGVVNSTGQMTIIK